jgi:O-antigen/teichoic acid export membrane protein
LKITYKNILQNPFLISVATLTSGTIISQFIVIATSPLLARLYSVEAFGILSLFSSFMVIFGVITTGRYELAIGLPGEDKKAKNLILLIALIGLSVSFLYLIVIFFIKEIVQYSDFSGLFQSNWIYLTPLYTFFIAIYSGLIYWNQRKKNYRKITISNGLQVISTTLFNILFGFLGIIEAGMMISLVIGIIISSFFLLKDFKKEGFVFHFNSVKTVGSEYISFPKYMILSDLSLTISQQYIPIIFAGLFSSTIVGYFALANRIVRLPNIILTSSIANVFRNDAIDAIREKGNCQQLYLSTLKKMILMSLPIFTLVFIFSPILFTFFFGQKWEIAGNFSRILSIMLLGEFVATPLNSLFYIFEKQKKMMRLQLINAIFGFLMIYLGYKIFNDAFKSLILFCFNSFVFNLIFIFLTYNFSKQKNNF